MKTKHLFACSAIAAGLMVSGTALADSPNYDYVGASYQTINDPSGSGFSSDHAYGVFGSYAFTENFLGQAGYSHESADFNALGFSGSASANIYTVGIGWRFPLNANVDLVPNLSYISAQSSGSVAGFSNSQTDTGYDAGVTLRAMLAEKWELDASVDHSTPGASSNSLGLGVLYSFSPAFALGVGYGTSTANGQDTNAWTLTGRFYFGK